MINSNSHNFYLLSRKKPPEVVRHATMLGHRVCACAGGVLAYGAARFGRDVIPLADEVVCTVATLLAASGAQLVGQRAGSAYAAKLSTITFLLVLLGSKDTPSELERAVISSWHPVCL